MKRTIAISLALGLILAASFFGHYGVVAPQASSFGMPNFHAASANLDGNVTNAPSSQVAYDEQIGLTFTQSFPSLTYNVTAVAQQDSDNYGPAYLLNGLTSAGYWYQIGIAWQWPELNGGYTTGFNVNYNVFNSKGTVVLPPNGSGGVIATTGGTINQGDNVGLSLSFSGGNVLMKVYDWSTGATAQVTYSSEAATEFIGLSGPLPANPNGFFSGLMTEQYHDNPYTGSEQAVQYSNTAVALSSAILWIDEYNVNNNQPQFGNYTGVISFGANPQFQSYSLDGASETANANNLITGSSAVSAVHFTLSYSVIGGGAGDSAPTFSYISNGVQQSATLTTSPVVYTLDAGTTWSITNPLSGSTTTERWETNQTTSASSLSATTINFVFYHQFYVSFSYSVVGGGSGYAAPTATAVQFSSKNSVPLGQKAWVDAGSQYSYANPLIGSTQSERWEASNSSSPTGQISSSSPVSPQYYHQFAVSAEFTVANGGLPPTAPAFTSESFGATSSSALATTATSFWADMGTNYNISSVITGSLERWITNSSTIGTVTSQLSLNFIYNQQYYVTMQTPQAGGTVTPASEWVNAGNSISISNSAIQGWKFEFWTGTGTGSYSGSTNSTTINVQAPITENATFYVGLTIVTSSGGSVSYTFGNTGSVHVTSQANVYVSPGTVVTLNANPSSLLYKLNSWSGSVTGAFTQTSVTVSSPSTAEAQFGRNYVNIGVIVAAVVIALIIIAAVMMRRKPS